MNAAPITMAAPQALGESATTDGDALAGFADGEAAAAFAGLLTAALAGEDATATPGGAVAIPAAAGEEVAETAEDGAVDLSLGAGPAGAGATATVTADEAAMVDGVVDPVVEALVTADTAHVSPAIAETTENDGGGDPVGPATENDGGAETLQTPLDVGQAQGAAFRARLQNTAASRQPTSDTVAPSGSSTPLTVADSAVAAPSPSAVGATTPSVADPTVDAPAAPTIDAAAAVEPLAPKAAGESGAGDPRVGATATDPTTRAASAAPATLAGSPDAGDATPSAQQPLADTTTGTVASAPAPAGQDAGVDGASSALTDTGGETATTVERPTDAAAATQPGPTSRLAPTEAGAGLQGSDGPRAAVPGPPAHQLATAVAAMRRRGDGEYTASLDLHPAELGRVQVEVEIRAGVVNVHVNAEQSSTRALLAAQLDDLRSALAQGGLDAGQLDVSQQGWSDQSRDDDPDPQQERNQTAPTGPAESREPAATTSVLVPASGLDVRL